MFSHCNSMGAAVAMETRVLIPSGSKPEATFSHLHYASCKIPLQLADLLRRCLYLKV